MTIGPVNCDEQELSPDQQLAALVTDALIEEGLLAQSRKERFSTKLATGQLKAEDWRIYAAAAVLKPSPEGAE